MSDSNAPDEVNPAPERSREQRVLAIKRWIEYIETHEPGEWGGQLNRLVDSQLESAQASEISVEQRRRVAQAGREHASRSRE